MKREQTIDCGVIRTTAAGLAGWSALALLLTWFSGTVRVMAQPLITRQPTNLSLSIGATAIFRVAATSTNGPISYQWRHQDAPLLNATNATLTLTNIQIVDAGLYIVTLTNAGGATTSAPALLDVDPTWTRSPRIRS